MLEDFVITNSKKKSLKNEIILILSEEWPLTIKKIYNKVKKSGYNVSYQAVFKTLKALLEVDIVEKKGKEYKLNLNWIEKSHNTMGKIKQSLLMSDYKVKPEERKELVVHPNISVYLDRNSTTKALANVTNRAEKGDILFGQCRTCTDYPKDFYGSLIDAMKRGAIINFIIPKSLDTVPFVEFLYRLSKKNPRKVNIKTTDKDYVRLFGIVNKEIMIALPFTDSFRTIHFHDKRMTNYVYRIFKYDWKESEIYRTGGEKI